MSDDYRPSGATRANLAYLEEQLEAVRAEDPARYEAMAEGARMALAAIREACDRLLNVFSKVA